MRPRREEEYDVEPEDSEVSSGDDEVSEGNARGEGDEDDESEGESGSATGSEVRYLDRKHTSISLQCHNSPIQMKPLHQK